MEIFKIENMSFEYPNKNKKALNDINIIINRGDFVTICGKSGCGKTTLLRLLKTSLSPSGTLYGNIYYCGRPLAEYDVRAQASQIGFVMQSPDNQLVTDKVWHELAFGLESLGYSTSEIRTGVSEMASFFGIQNWFHKKISELSGGQKQLLNLASVMVMQPSVLILDEPTAQLDPIGAQEFLRTLEKLNRETGVTVILTEHRLEEAFAVSDRVIVLDEGVIIADGAPCEVGELLKKGSHDMYDALPAPMRIYCEVEGTGKAPLTVREGRRWLEDYHYSKNVDNHIPFTEKTSKTGETAIEVKDVWFRYEKNLPDVVKGLDFSVNKGELFAIVGGNGTGKTTALSLVSGINKPQRGEILINGKNISDIASLYTGMIGVLPQNPQSVFAGKTVRLELEEMIDEKQTAEEKATKVYHISALCRIEKLLDSHPYDLSGGEQQRVALAKILLKSPQILLMDEPTKGMDAHFKKEFADILSDLKEDYVAIVMVSHDIEFCAEYADRCAMFFDGNITASGTPRRFFAGNSFYTTSANRMSRTVIPEAVLAEDVIKACGGKVRARERTGHRLHIDYNSRFEELPAGSSKKVTSSNLVMGSVFILLFAVSAFLIAVPGVLQRIAFSEGLLRIISILELGAAFFCFFPQREIGVEQISKPSSEGKATKRTVVSALLILLAIPVTIYAGGRFFDNRKYLFISMLIILETMIPFCMIFESRKPQARELVIISVLCALSVAGRAAFFMFPQFKPVVALVMISGICFGGETGFLVGSISGFVSNFFFGQGPWTPWQMFAFGIIGFLSGILFKKGFIRKTRGSLSIIGFLMTFFIYGGIMNPAAVIMAQDKITIEMLAASYLAGMPLDIIHSFSTAFFLWFIAGPMIDKLERIKIKYGLIKS